MPLSRTATPTPAPVGPPSAGAATSSEADGQVGDVDGAVVVEPEHRVVGDDEIDAVARGERVDLLLRQIRGHGVERGQVVVSTPTGTTSSTTPVGAGVRVDDDRHGVVPPVASSTVVTLASILLLSLLVRGQCRRGQGQETEQRDREDQVLGSHLHRLHASAPLACRLAQGRQTLPLSVSRGGTSERRSSLRSRSATAIRVRQPSYLDHLKTSGFASLPHDRFAFVVQGRYRRLARES